MRDAGPWLGPMSTGASFGTNSELAPVLQAVRRLAIHPLVKRRVSLVYIETSPLVRFYTLATHVNCYLRFASGPDATQNE